jgi:hypothetical protein
MTSTLDRGRRGVWIGAAGTCLLMYGLASWLEAIWRPAKFGFNEPLSWPPIFGALRVTGWSDVERLELPPFCIVAVLGMSVTLAWSALSRRPIRALEGVQAALVWTYTLLLVLVGGWVCVAALPFELVERHDGECLRDGGLRMIVVGVWTILCLIASWSFWRADAGRIKAAASRAVPR